MSKPRGVNGEFSFFLSQAPSCVTCVTETQFHYYMYMKNMHAQVLFSDEAKIPLYLHGRFCHLTIAGFLDSPGLESPGKMLHVLVLESFGNLLNC